jgi:hypothetical protein
LGGDWRYSFPRLHLVDFGAIPDADSEVAYDPSELLGFLGRHFGPMNEMCERAGLSESAIYTRTKRVFKYFDLPFSA